MLGSLKGELSPANVVGAAVKVIYIATGEEQDETQPVATAAA